MHGTLIQWFSHVSRKGGHVLGAWGWTSDIAAPLSLLCAMAFAVHSGLRQRRNRWRRTKVCASLSPYQRAEVVVSQVGCDTKLQLKKRIDQKLRD